MTTVGARAPCSVWPRDLCRGDEVSRWWWALAGRAGAAGDIAVAGGAAVRRGRGAGAGCGPAAGQHEVGLSVAATLACRRRAGVGLHRSGRDKLPAQRRPAAPAAHRAGARAGRARLGRPALDPGPGRDADRAAIPSPVHPTRNRVPAAPDGLVVAGAPAPRGRAQRGRDRPVAYPDLGEGTRLAASTGAWIVIWGRGRGHPASAEGAHLGWTRAYPAGCGVRSGWAGVDGRAGLLPARRPQPAVLPNPGASPPHRRAAQLLRR